MRARLALEVSGLECRLREVVLRDKPPEMLAVSPKGTVPVFIDADGTLIEESLDLMLHALAKNDPDQWLEPQTGSREDMLALIASCDGDFKYNLDRYKYPNRYDLPDGTTHRNAGAEFLRTLDQRLTVSDYLFGSRLSLADCAIFPFVRQYANTDRSWFDQQDWAHLRNWLNERLESRAFKAIMTKYPQWKTGDPEPVFPNPI